MTKIISLNSDNFRTLVTNSEKPFLVDFFAVWCGPCSMMSPIVEEIAEKYDGLVSIGSIDVDAEPSIAAEFGIQSIPTLILFKDGIPVAKTVGYSSKENVISFLDSACEPDNSGKKSDKFCRLNGTRTLENLRKAFSSEAEARDKYSFFADVARKDGYEQIAEIFDKTADNEKEHAEIWLEELNAIGDTSANLLSAANDENHEWSEIYAKFARVAEEEGFADLAEKFRKTGAIEMRHEKRFRDLLHNVQAKEVFAKSGLTVWECRVCGHIEVSRSAPAECPVCGHEQGFFEVHADNF